VVYAVERDKLRYEYLKKILGSLNTRCVEITPVNEDATEFIKRYERQDLGFVFVDIDKGQYEYFFEEARKRIIRGGVIAFHNAYVVHRFVSKLIDSGYKVVIVPTGEGILLVRFT
jgi:predicted O-methyltransferase YrrM